MPDEEKEKEQEQKGGKEENPQREQEPGKSQETETPTPTTPPTDTVSKAEYQDIQTKYETLKSQVEKDKETQLKEKEDYKGLYETEKQKGTEKDTLLKQKEVKTIALQYGMHDPQDLIPLMEKFKFDEQLNVTNDKEVMEKLKQDKSYLFKKEKEDVPNTDTTPTPLDGGKVKDLEEMTLEDYKKNRGSILKRIQEKFKK